MTTSTFIRQSIKAELPPERAVFLSHALKFVYKKYVDEVKEWVYNDI